MKPGLKMKIRRLELGKTQTDLREETKISSNIIVALEKGEIDSVKVSTLRKVAKALDSEVKDLFFE